MSIQATLRQGEAEVVLASPAVIGGLVQALRRIQQDHGLSGELRAADVARFPGVIELAETGGGIDEERRLELLGAVEKALGELEQMRRAEGETLQAVLRAALDAVEAAAGRIEALSVSERAARRASSASGAPEVLTISAIVRSEGSTACQLLSWSTRGGSVSTPQTGAPACSASAYSGTWQNTSGLSGRTVRAATTASGPTATTVTRRLRSAPSSGVAVRWESAMAASVT